MKWPHKHLLDVEELTPEEIYYIFELAHKFEEINLRPIKKIPTLKGKSVILYFSEPSTRTKTSFDIAAKRLSADVFSLQTKGSSEEKGESLKDTVLTLQAMHPDLIVIRHKQSGAAKFVSEKVDCSVVNAGDGTHAHPTQALLDGYTLYKEWKNFKDKTVLILGDIAHSRVARSDIKLYHKLGIKVRVCGPKTLMPKNISNWGVEVFYDLKEAIKGIDAVECLRLQLERQEAGLLPSLREYSIHYGLSKQHLKLAKDNVKVMHPGPMNRGIEISSDIADSKNSLILEQVSAGVAIRMALLYLFLT